MTGPSLALLVLVALMAGLAGGVALGWLVIGGRTSRSVTDELRRQLAAGQGRAREVEALLAEATRGRAVAETQSEDLRARLDEQGSLLARAEARLGDTFRALAADALRANNQGFIALAGEALAAAKRESTTDLEGRQRAFEALVAPVKDALAKVDGGIQELARERGVAFGQVVEQLRGVVAAQDRLSSETGNLARALRAPNVRGRWGEIQLKRVVELAGMVEHCDFSQQVNLLAPDDGGRLRPDMIVRLPEGRQIVVDAKVPLEGYLQALEATTEDRRRVHLQEHAAQVRAHIEKLASKAYWAALVGTPELVVMFLPSDAIFGAALEGGPGLLEQGIDRRVLLATPTTLIALLQTVHHGWRQARIAQNAESISAQGRLLHERIATLADHWARVGGALGKATEHFNAAVASWEGRVLPAARRLESLGAAGRKPIAVVAQVEARSRLLSDPGAEDHGAVLGPGEGAL